MPLLQLRLKVHAAANVLVHLVHDVSFVSAAAWWRLKIHVGRNSQRRDTYLLAFVKLNEHGIMYPLTCVIICNLIWAYRIAKLPFLCICAHMAFTPLFITSNRLRLLLLLASKSARRRFEFSLFIDLLQFLLFHHHRRRRLTFLLLLKTFTYTSIFDTRRLTWRWSSSLPSSTSLPLAGWFAYKLTDILVSRICHIIYFPLTNLIWIV